MQGDAAVGHLDLQGVAQGAHQFTAANRMGQVIITAVALVKQHQAAAVAEGVQLALIQAGGLVQAVTVALQQVHQT